MSIHQQLYDAAKARKLRLSRDFGIADTGMAPKRPKGATGLPKPAVQVIEARTVPEDIPPPLPSKPPTPVPDRIITCQEILRTVAALTGVSVSILCSPRRSRHLVEGRFVVYWIARKHTALSFPHIGRMIGRRDHSTVLHGVARVEAALKNDTGKFEPLLARALELLGLEAKEVPFE